MIAKFFPVTVALVTAVAGSAAAHETHGERGAPYRAPAPTYSAPVGHPNGGDAPATGYRAEEREELRRSDLNRDGRVTLAEALQQGRRGFRHSDRDQNRALTRREVSWGDLAHEDRDRNGRISYGEYQDAIRRTFYRFDTNRDGVLARFELRAMAPRPAGWRR